MEAADINSSPRVSVIVPAYMTSHLIVGALDSVMEQTFRDFEILVVNDGSPDTTELEKVLAPYSEKIVYIKQENKRAAGARNTAIRKAKAEFLAFLDSDDTWLPDHLASQMTLFEQDQMAYWSLQSGPGTLWMCALRTVIQVLRRWLWNVAKFRFQRLWLESVPLLEPAYSTKA